MTVPNPLTCAETAAHLHELMDGELTEALEAAVQHHLDECEPCYGLYEFERAFKRFLVERGRAPAAPSRLRQRISERLATEDAPSP